MLSKAPLLRAQVGNDSDIIAVVPRGVGSTFPPMTCDATDLDATRRLWEIQDALPGYTRKSAAESYALGQNLGLDCASVAPDILPYIGTIYAAHDMDFVRQALGQEKLSYLGYSYGTVLGGTYAALFPDKVGRMVLDGVLDFNDYYSSNKDPRLDIGDADLALDNFFQACHEAGPDSCAIWANGTEAVRKRFLKADRQLLDSPLPVASYGLLKWPSWRSGVYNALYRPAPGFPLLAGVASEILDGDCRPLHPRIHGPCAECHVIRRDVLDRFQNRLEEQSRRRHTHLLQRRRCSIIRGTDYEAARRHSRSVQQGQPILRRRLIAILPDLQGRQSHCKSTIHTPLQEHHHRHSHPIRR